MRRLPVQIVLCLGAAVWIAACTPGPTPLKYGLHECDHCRMTLMDERYGGELVTRTGKTYTFDSIECMAAFDSGQSVPAEKVHGRYVVDFGEPGKLISVEEAIFLQSTQLLSPMGANLTSFARAQDAYGAKDVFGGEILSWTEVRHHVQNEWMQEAAVPRDSS